MVISWWVEICTSNLQDLHLRTAPTPGRTVGLSEEWDPRNYKVAPDSTKFNSQPNLLSKTCKRSGVLKKNNNAKIHQHLTSKTETENFLSKKNNYKTSRWTYLLGFPKKPRQKASQSFQPTTLEILSIHGALSSPWCSSSTVTLSPSFASRSPSSWTSSWRHFPNFCKFLSWKVNFQQWWIAYLLSKECCITFDVSFIVETHELFDQQKTKRVTGQINMQCKFFGIYMYMYIYIYRVLRENSGQL